MDEENEEDLRYKLWEFFNDEHDLILICCELDNIIHKVNEYNNSINKKEEE